MLQLQPTYSICTSNTIPILDNDNVYMKYVKSHRFWQQHTILHMTGLCSELHVHCTELWTIHMTVGTTLTSMNNSLHISQLNEHASVSTHWWFFRLCLLVMNCYKYSTDMVTPTTTAETCPQITPAAECLTKHMTGIWTISTMYALMYPDLL